jgi:rubrerythrin
MLELDAEGRWICPLCGLHCDREWLVCPACDYVRGEDELPEWEG